MTAYELPTSLNISGVDYSIRTDFRVIIDILIMYGLNDITNGCSYTVTKSDSVTGSWDVNTHTYTVTGLIADNGWVDIKATYLQTLSITRRFTIAKLKAGKNGVNGLDGLQGEKGEQGVPGKDGKDGTNGVDGKTSYFHIKYSSVANPTSSSQMTETPSTYIGTYVDYEPNDSTDPKKYTWSKFKGSDGKDGIAGTNGTDGKTYYLHIAYANSADGRTGFSVDDSVNKLYIGQYTDYTPNDSTDPTKYSWTKIKGEQGVPGKDGKDGTNGVDGKTSYFHIKYSSVANPTSSSQMTETPSTYIGTYVDYEPNDSTDPKKYTWSKFKGSDGKDGIAGTNGTDGKTYYLHIAYANSADGRTGFSVDDSVNKLYIGQYTDYTPNDSTDPTKYSWTKIKGEQGTAGRTYFFQSNADVLLMGADKKITPSSLIVDSFYRDGNGEIAQSQKGWWKRNVSKI